MDPIVTVSDPSAPAHAPAAAPPPQAAPVAGGVKIIDDRNATVVDSKGRVIKVKKLSALDRMRLFKLVGAEAAENRSFMSYASLAASVQEVDGEPIGFPSSQIKLDYAVQKLDEHGLEAIVNALAALSPEMGAVEETARNL